MSQATPPGESGVAAKRKHRRTPLSRLTRSVLDSRLVARAAGLAMHGAYLLVRHTQAMAEGSSDWRGILTRNHPAIVGLWHGQHLAAPFFRPEGMRFVALLSKNRDAELNAMLLERLGVETVRGSGGRERRKTVQKGGVRALIALRAKLRENRSVVMIADVPKVTVREAGKGIVTLARISGRPILPSAGVTSRRKVVTSAWDRTSVPLPFGRMAVVIGEPIYVPADADEATMEAKRQEVTAAIEAANRRAEALASDGRP